MIGTRLLLRLFALLLALSAGAAAAAPPCLGLLLAEAGCVAGEDDHGCGDGCCGETDDGCGEEDGCGVDCDDCTCCPFRAPGTVAALGLNPPELQLHSNSLQATPSAPANETEGVFRPPRRSA